MDNNKPNNMTPGMLAEMKLRIAREMKRNPEYKKKVLQQMKDFQKKDIGAK